MTKGFSHAPGIIACNWKQCNLKDPYSFTLIARYYSVTLIARYYSVTLIALLSMTKKVLQACKAFCS